MRFRLPATTTSKRVRALLACGILLGTGAIGTSALWSTTSHTLSGQFTTATIEIRANGSAAATVSFPDTLLPGYTTATMVDVKNTGTLAFTYLPSVGSSNTATSVGQWTTLKSTVVAAGTSVTGTSTGTTCPAGIATLVSAQNVTTAKAGFSGVVARPLAIGTTERLCMQLTLRMDTPASFAGLASAGTVTFTFDATG
ncbi:hypothetical protein [Gordonia neofelifaecis]|uniref:Ribosomally synthesized peptide with SipW-like signal peptide n=1 Tax=Gordonia neofelifaecis NRRL B-59395 TaxID=644548 RepID=F1YEU9_9ACTN|nr:hypothetical protein [Gordonia neofelifaecis]EGD56932.1 hypothetical protein SCNU_01100 [Gordonia neofelifaecis NRRL B-59395]